MSKSKEKRGVDLPLFSPRMEESPPEEVHRDETMSSPSTIPVTDETRYYRIGEVSRLTALKPFVLRYWETEFPMLEPVKGANGHRLYRQEDVDLVLKIKRLLYDEGFTIAGARRHLKELESSGDSGDAAGHFGSTGEQATTSQLSRKMLLDLRDGLRSFLTLLERK
jgi:DNA-binding transcriptional MerR regulator